MTIFKGHFNFLKQPSDYLKAIIYTLNNDKEYKRKEYFYSKGKVLKIIDYINDIISEYEYLNEDDYLIHFYTFEGSPSNKTLDSIKEITFSNGQKVKETLVDIQNGQKAKIYTGNYEYSDDYLSNESYKYSENEIYRIKHEWNKNKSLYKITHLDEPDKVRYTFDKYGFLMECLFFKYEGSVKKTEYEYKNGKLFKLVQFPHLEYKETLFGKIKLTQEAQFMDETEYYYLQNGLLEKEIVKDYETKDIVQTIFYKYEKQL